MELAEATKYPSKIDKFSVPHGDQEQNLNEKTKGLQGVILKTGVLRLRKEQNDAPHRCIWENYPFLLNIGCENCEITMKEKNPCRTMEVVVCRFFILRP